MDARQRAIYTRDTLIELLATEAATLAHEPEPGASVHKMLAVLDALDTACRTAIATLHTSSHAMYAERDLPNEVSTEWKRAQHSLRLVRMLHGPREAPCPDPGHHADPPRFPIPQREQDDARQADTGAQR